MHSGIAKRVSSAGEYRRDRVVSRRARREVTRRRRGTRPRRRRRRSAFPPVSLGSRRCRGRSVRSRSSSASGFLMFVAFAITLPNFLSYGNLITLIRSVSVLGILAIAMAIVVIGRGIDLSLIAVMAISTAFTLRPAERRLAALVSRCSWAGLCSPGRHDHRLHDRLCRDPGALHHTCDGRLRLRLRPLRPVHQDIITLPKARRPRLLGAGQVFGVPVPVVLFALIALVVAAFLRYARLGQFVYANGRQLQRGAHHRLPSGRCSSCNM